jgi:hypothetical protein
MELFRLQAGLGRFSKSLGGGFRMVRLPVGARQVKIAKRAGGVGQSILQIRDSRAALVEGQENQGAGVEQMGEWPGHLNGSIDEA